jgi:hypothetical protein
MLYDANSLEPSSYYVLGFPMLPLEHVPTAEREGFRDVKMQQADHKHLTLPQLAELLFPIGTDG